MGEGYVPKDKYSNFAMALAEMYKCSTQKHIQAVFNEMYDLIQGVQKKDLFSQEGTEAVPKTLKEAIKQVLNIDYNGKNGNSVLGSDTQVGTAGRRRSEETLESRGGDAMSTRSAEVDRGTSEGSGIESDAAASGEATTAEDAGVGEAPKPAGSVVADNAGTEEDSEKMSHDQPYCLVV